MSNETREKILKVACNMFNERGYERVTMREIAECSGIAVGNVTYHFHKKADIASEIMRGAFVDAMPAAPIKSLGDLTDQFDRMLETLTRYAFYFIDDTFIEEQTSHNNEIRNRILDGFKTLVEMGLFSTAFDSGTQVQILDMLLLTHVTWMRFSLRSSSSPSKTELLRGHWAVLKPYLTEKGCRDYEDIATQPPLA